jgi:hypothetical protein
MGAGVNMETSGGDYKDALPLQLYSGERMTVRTPKAGRISINHNNPFSTKWALLIGTN